MFKFYYVYARIHNDDKMKSDVQKVYCISDCFNVIGGM